jgi:Tfp pilus assembly protein PilX
MNRPLPPRSAGPAAQRGASLVVVLVLLMVMLLGGLSLARMTEVGALVAGNVSLKERALQASEMGVNEAFQAVQALVNNNANVGTWYFAQQRAVDGHGMPTGIDWATAAVIAGDSGPFEVRYIVDRMCVVLDVDDPETQCLLKQGENEGSATYPPEPIDPLAGTQFRITVRITGPKEIRTFVQALVTQG